MKEFNFFILNFYHNFLKLGFGGEGEEIEKLRMEIVRLEKIISELREQLKSKRPVS